MTTRAWGATGVDAPRPESLSDVVKEHIDQELRRFDCSPTSGFYEALSLAIAVYHSHKAVAKHSSPGQVRATLKKAQSAATKLQDAMLGLDANSWQLLREAGFDPVLLRQHAGEIKAAFDLAPELAKSYPSAGALPDDARVYLARDVADALQTHLSIKPTTTKSGCFDSVLSIVLEEATEKQVNATHELMPLALSMAKTQSGGLTEYQRSPKHQPK
jgi:hypothetical protein